MARYHLSPKTGMPQKCSASISCPYGSMLTHYDNKARALQAQEQVNKLKFSDGGLAQVHERPITVGRPPQVKPAQPAKPPAAAKSEELTHKVAFANAYKARAQAGNERGAFVRSYLKKISVAEQLKLFRDYEEPIQRAVLAADELPLKDDLLVQDGIIYRVTGYSSLRNEVHIHPLVATKGREALYPTGQVLSNYTYAENEKRIGLRKLTPEEIADRAARRKALSLEADLMRKQSLEILENAEVETYDYLSSLNVTLEGINQLVADQNKKLGKLNGELVYHRRVSGMNFVDKAANRLASAGELTPQYIAVLNSAGSSAYVVSNLRKELWETPRSLESENRRIASEFEKDPEDPVEPQAPGFWKKLFNGKAEEEHTEEVQEYQEEKQRKAAMRDKYAKNSSLLTAYGAHSAGGNSQHHVDASLSYSYGAVAISTIKNLYNSEKVLSMEDNVELKRILESHIPEALNVASDRNLDSSDRARLNGALSNIVDRIETIRKRSGTLSQMESKKTIEFLEVKFGDHS